MLQGICLMGKQINLTVMFLPLKRILKYSTTLSVKQWYYLLHWCQQSFKVQCHYLLGFKDISVTTKYTTMSKCYANILNGKLLNDELNTVYKKYTAS